MAPVYARRRGVQRTLPFKPGKKGEGPTRASVTAGLEALLAANDRLSEYRAYLDALKAGEGELPPAAPSAKKKKRAA